MRNFKLRFLVVSVFFAFTINGFTQDTKALYKEGNKLFKLEHYRKALPYLEKVVEAEPNNADAVFEAGVCYLHRYSKEKALEYIQKAYSLDSNVSKYIHFWLGRAYHQNYMYDKAIKEYTVFKNNYKKSDQRHKDVEKHIIQTNNARQLTQNPENYKITNLGPIVNTHFSEHSPVTSQNDSILLFTSRRNDNVGGKEDLDGEFYEDIFQSRKMSNGEWSKPETIQLNTSGHDASVQLFDNDSKLLLYREDKGGDIYITEKDAATGAWKDPMKFGDINTSDFEADAFITSDGKTAYFATNHFKKTGDLDIYYITKMSDGSWSKPQELEGRINTSEDEDAPFLSPDGNTLYFSSRGHKNMGGFDVFKSTRDTVNNTWSNPVNMGFPINTPDDDVYFYMSADGKISYMSSYREGGYGEKDIYSITPILPTKFEIKVGPVCEGKKRENLNYLITSVASTSGKPVKLSGQVMNDKAEVSLLSSNSYRVSVFGSKDTLFSEVIDIPSTEVADQLISKEITIACPEPVKDTTTLIASSKASPYLFRTVYFEHGNSTLTPEAKREVAVASEILKKNPTAIVKVRGVADGDEKSSLASQRAKALHNELLANGVKNVVSDTISKIKGEDRKNGSAGLEVDLKAPLNKDFDPTVINQASVGDNFILRNVHFSSGKSELTRNSKDELEVLAKIMAENPALAVQVVGHTDNVGEEKSNQKLSEERAKAVKDYLVKTGVSESRLSSVGYGESQPITDNSTEKGRSINRRTELKVRK